MGKVKLTDTLKRRIALATLALAALMLLDGIYQAGMHVKWRRWIPKTLAAERATTQPTDTQPSDTQPADSQPTGTRPADTQAAGTQAAGSRPASTRASAKKPAGRRPRPGSTTGKSKKTPAVHAAIKRRNIMAQPKPKGHGMQLTGVLGNVALFKARDGKTVGIEEGKSSGGIKVKAIKGYEVTIEFQGKAETMKLFSEQKERGRRTRGPDRRRSGGTRRHPGLTPRGVGGTRQGPSARRNDGGRSDRITAEDSSDSGVARTEAARGPSSRPMAKE